MEKEVLEEYISLFEKVAHKSANLEELQKKYEPNSVFDDLWKIQCKMPPKTKRFYPLVPK